MATTEGKNMVPVRNLEIFLARNQKNESMTLIVMNLGQMGSQHKIEIKKFDSTNNFNMWCIEVIDALMTANLEDKINLVVRPIGIKERVWVKWNMMNCALIRSCLVLEIKYQVINEVSTYEMWKVPNEKYVSQTIENCVRLKLKFYSFNMQKSVSI